MKMLPFIPAGIQHAVGGAKAMAQKYLQFTGGIGAWIGKTVGKAMDQKLTCWKAKSLQKKSEKPFASRKVTLCEPALEKIGRLAGVVLSVINPLPILTVASAGAIMKLMAKS